MEEEKPKPTLEQKLEAYKKIAEWTKEQKEDTSDKNDYKFSNVVPDLILENERNVFAYKLIFRSISYLLISILLNSIRQSTSLWILWSLIIIQFSLYFLIFILCYNRVKICGLNKNISFYLFLALAIIGRIENFEVVLIPLMVVIMLIVSSLNKKLSPNSELWLIADRKRINENRMSTKT